MKKISVICPTFNRPELIKHTVYSFLEQDYPDKELIIINDGGNEYEFIKELRSKEIIYIHKENGGVGSALAQGVEESSGSLLCLLPDDDLFYGDQSLMRRSLPFKLNKNIDVICTSTVGIDEYGNQIAKYPIEALDKKRIWRQDYINTLGMMWRRSVHDKIGNFDTRLKCNDDWDWKMRCLFGCNVIRISNFITAKWRRHEGANSMENESSGLRKKMEALIRKKIIKQYGNKYKWLLDT